MSSLSSLNARHQRGDVLIESLIGVLLMAIIGLGVIYAVSRVMVTQRDMNLQNIAVGQMRTLLQQYGTSLCPGETNNAKAVLSLPSNLASAALQLDVACSVAAPVTVQGVILETAITSPARTVVLSTRESDRTLFGGIIRVGDQT